MSNDYATLSQHYSVIIYLLSLYKQGPDLIDVIQFLSRVSFWCTYFPPKNDWLTWSGLPRVALRLLHAFCIFELHAILHSSCIPVAWFCVSFLSREKKTWKTLAWCCCSMMAITTGSFSCLLCCSCSCLSHHWLSPTVVVYTHNPTLRKISSFAHPSSAFYCFLFFSISSH